MEQLDQYNCEILIIGSGPAGCSAAIYCGRAQRDVLILDGKQESALEYPNEIMNYPGYELMTGPELLKSFRDHAQSHETVRLIKGDVISLIIGMGSNMISTRTANITADAVIIATGRGLRKESIKGEEALNGFGVSYCALCDGPLYKDRVVFIYGNDEEALEEALILQQMGCIVNIITEVGIEDLPDKIKEVKDNNIKVFDKYQIIEVVGNNQGIVQKIICSSTDPNKPNEIKTFELDCLFILSHLPSNSIFKKAGIELDERGNIKVDMEQKTNVKGVFAAGDVTGGLYQVVFATSEGARAGINANKYVRQLKKE
ncbi:MAG: NAD(P)/FAD-dependent oxidoreductase [Candidatus Hodarchaeota archaeon]